MRALKLTIFAAIAFAAFRYVPVYYHTSEFNKFVQGQVRRIRAAGPLKEAILDKALEHRLPVTAENISITTRDSVLRVMVDYTVPVNFVVFNRNMSFHAVGSGLMLSSSGD